MAVAAALISCIVAYLIYTLRRPRPTAADGVVSVSALDHFRFICADFFGRGQAPILRQLHAKYGPRLCIGSLYSFAGSGSAGQDAELFRAISRLPKSARVYGIFDPPVPDEQGELHFHQTIFTQRDQAKWRTVHKQGAPMFRVQAVRERQDLIWTRMAKLLEHLDALAGREVDLTPPCRAFAVDLTCLYLVNESYGAQESLADGQHHRDRRKDIGPILTALNLEFGLAYWLPRLSHLWLAKKDSLAALFARFRLFPRHTLRWAIETDSLTGWTDFVDKEVAAAAQNAPENNFATLMLGEATSSEARQAATAQLLDAIFAGTDTLTATLSIAAYILSGPEERIREAVEAIRGELPSSKPWRLQELESLQWLSATVREILRLSDANPHLLERVIPSNPSDASHSDLALLPPGARVGVAGYVVHRDMAAYGPDSAAFDARRWLPSDHPSHHNGSKTIASEDLSTYWMAFGRSPRACIAQTLAQAVVVAFVATWCERYDGVQAGPADLVEDRWRDCFNKVFDDGGRMPVRLSRRKV